MNGLYLVKLESNKHGFIQVTMQLQDGKVMSVQSEPGYSYQAFQSRNSEPDYIFGRDGVWGTMTLRLKGLVNGSFDPILKFVLVDGTLHLFNEDCHGEAVKIG